MKKHKKGITRPPNASGPGQSHGGPTRPSSTGARVESVLETPGRSLDAPVRQEMEWRFGHDFSRVRIHNDARAAESAEALGSYAYTVGRHIVFGEGAYSPESDLGRGLLAHELVHVLQQQAAGEPPTGTLEQQGVADAAEREASVVAMQAMLGPSERSESNSSRLGHVGDLKAPDHVHSAMKAGRQDSARYQQAMLSFRQRHDDGRLDQHWSLLEEARPGAKPGPISQLQHVRVASCARGQDRQQMENRQQLQENLPGNDEMVREIFRFFYPTLTQPTRLTDELRGLAARMLAEAIEGSRAMDYVPRPPNVPNPKWLFKQAVKIAWRRGKDEGIYDAVRQTVALRHRSDFELAKIDAQN